MYFYNASENEDRTLLTKLELFSREKGLEMAVIDCYKSDKIRKVLGGGETPSLSY